MNFATDKFREGKSQAAATVCITDTLELKIGEGTSNVISSNFAIKHNIYNLQGSVKVAK